MLLTSRSIVLATALFSSATLTIAPNLLAQSQSINGTIRGRASDPTGASVSGATVTVVNKAVGVNRTTQTSSDGYYTFLFLPLGSYTVTFTAPGFSTLTVNSVELSAGTEASVDGGLTVGGATTQVTVTAENTGVDPTSTEIKRTLDSREVENLPLTSRNPYNFIVFQPGVSGHPNAELGIPRTLNTNGLLDRINYQMDGMVNTQSDRYGLRLFPIGNIFVKEVQTVSNPSAPEYGWTAGDVYNVITGSGTNTYHGLVQYLQRWQDATAYPLLQNKTTSPVKPNLELEDISANAGGRIIRDRLFFFGSYEQLTRGVPAPVTITAANASALGLGSDQLVTAPGLLHGKFADARLDYTINAKNQAFLRYNYFKNNFPFNTQVGGINARSTAADYVDRAHVFGAQLITTLSGRALNELRATIPLRANAHTPSFPTSDPAVLITGIAAIGASYNAGDQYTEKQPSFSDNVSYTRATHSFKAGVVFSQPEQRQRLISYNRYTFSSVANYLAAKNGINPRAYTQYDSIQDTLGLGYAAQFFGAYLQDTWQASPKLVAVYGLRWDRFNASKANANALYPDSRRFNVPNTNFAPRLGLTYRATDSTTLKVSAGMFYEPVPTNLWFNALNADGSNRTSSFSYTPTQAGSPAFPTVPSTVGTVAVQNVTTVSPTFKNEYTWNVNAQVSQTSFSKHDSFTLGYIMASGRNLMFQRNVNLINPIGQLADGRPVFSSAINATTRADARFNQVNRVESGANSSFNALLVNYTLRPVHGLQLNANYTWSHTITDAPEVNTFEQNASIEDTTNRKRDRGNSYVNRPNAFNLTAVFEPQTHFTNPFLRTLANGNRLAVLSNFGAGDAANIVASVGTLNGDPSTGAVGRPAFVGRNTARAFAVYQVDARYTRSFKLFDRIEPSFLLEANNIFNHNNLSGLAITQPVQTFVVGGTAAQNANAGVATGTPTLVRSTVLESRIVQWGFAARF